MILTKLPAIMEARFFQFNATITANAGDAQLGSRQVTARLGFLWTGLAIDADSDLFLWRLFDQKGSIIDNEELIHANTFSGEGTVQANKTPSNLFPFGGGHYFRPGAVIRVNITELSGSNNAIFFTMRGVHVREGSPFEKDIIESTRYIGTF